jgi:endo-1,4-beta-xylanase
MKVVGFHVREPFQLVWSAIAPSCYQKSNRSFDVRHLADFVVRQVVSWLTVEIDHLWCARRAAAIRRLGGEGAVGPFARRIHPKQAGTRTQARRLTCFCFSGNLLVGVVMREGHSNLGLWCLVGCLLGISCSGSGSTSTASGGPSGKGGAAVSEAAGRGGLAMGGVSSGGLASVGENAGGAGSSTGGSGTTRPIGGDSETGNSDSGGTSALGGASSGGAAGSGSGSDASGGGGSGIGGTTAPGGASSGGAAGSGAGSDASGGGSSGVAGTTLDSRIKFVGNIVGTVTTPEQVDSETLVYSDYWDQITPEHAGTWGAVQTSSGFNWATLDAIYGYAQAKGIVFKEQSLVWGAQQPTMVIGEGEVRAWMRIFCERYPKTKIIDVVSEPLHSVPVYADNIGGGTNGSWKWIANAFVWAREACPNATLVLNDYNIIGNADENQRMIDIVKTLKAAGAPINAVGAELNDAAKVPTSTVKTLLEKLHDDTGLPVYITAYHVEAKDDAQQLQVYQSQFPVFWQAEYVHGITVWGWDSKTCSCNPDGMLVKDGVFRPAMKWLMQVLGRPAP